MKSPYITEGALRSWARHHVEVLATSAIAMPQGPAVVATLERRLSGSYGVRRGEALICTGVSLDQATRAYNELVQGASQQLSPMEVNALCSCRRVVYASECLQVSGARAWLQLVVALTGEYEVLLGAKSLYQGPDVGRAVRAFNDTLAAYQGCTAA